MNISFSKTVVSGVTKEERRQVKNDKLIEAPK